MTVLHREDGPAVETHHGDRFWYINGAPHREDGPATEWRNGDVEYYLKGEWMTQKEHAQRTAKVIELTLEEIAKLAGVDVSKLKIVKKKS